MKSQRIVFSTIFLLAIGAAALALRVKTTGEFKYCYTETETQPPIGECLRGAENASVRAFLPPNTKIYYTTTLDTTKCRLAECPNIGMLPLDQ